MQKQFTATAYVIQDERVLLIFHPKHRKWLPPGGHLESNETPPECARREVLEETGLQIALVKEEHIWVNRENAVSCERPFLCLIENIPAYQDQPAHQHIDFIFIGYPVEGKLHSCPSQLRWFTVQEVLELKSDEEIFADTQDIITTLFNLKMASL
jgi:8-oxo-dGTP pyrophosphatase MutT (NUDIX family)